jgi:hypothetical protein
MLADYDTGGPIETGLLQRREDSLFALSSVVEFRLRPSGARSGMTTITARGEIGGELLELSREIEVKVELTGLGRP